MDKLMFILLLLGSLKGCSQDDEFKKSGNGLIYPEPTVQKLKFIVDSLNLKYRVCDLSRVYVSKYQAKANYISLEGAKAPEAKKDIEAGIAFDDFVKKYNGATVDKDLLVVKFKYKDYEGNDKVEFSSMELGGKYRHELTFDKKLATYDKPLRGKWIYEYMGHTDYSKENIWAFYITDELPARPIPLPYAKMIQYSDCMVDTSTTVFYKKNKEVGGLYQDKDNQTSAVQNFMDYVHKGTHRPEYNKLDKNGDLEYFNHIHAWDSLRVEKVDSLKAAHEKRFNNMLADAINEAISHGQSNWELEDYTGRYYSKKAELELKRNRRVVGGCSMDQGPRLHALDIAELSAETLNWEIFLRAHLDIMNDRFERASDGSYAWGRRKTYIKELEVLDIDVQNLLLGICLRIENPSTNHYYGDVGRIGRALSETNKAAEIESKILQMISDNELDEYNRIIMYYLFKSYDYNLDDKSKQAENEKKLAIAVNTLPDYLSAKIKAGN